jgi:hypothetical protein
MDKYYSKHYSDPKAIEAPANVKQKEIRHRQLVYICSPFAGDTKHNIIRVLGYCRFAVSKGYIPLAPHLHYPQFMDDSDQKERELGLYFALVLLSKCDQLWVFGCRISDGMAQEISKAKKQGIPIRHFTEKCEEVQVT